MERAELGRSRFFQGESTDLLRPVAYKFEETALSGALATLIIRATNTARTWILPVTRLSQDLGFYSDRRRRGNPRWQVGFPAMNLRHPEIRVISKLNSINSSTLNLLHGGRLFDRS